MKGITAAALWSQLGAAGLVRGEVPQDASPDSPWYVRIMLGFAGWIGALFLLGFVGFGLAFLVRSGMAAVVSGTLLCAVMALLLRNRVGDFVLQFALAASLAGQALIAYGLYELTQDSLGHYRTAALLFAGVEGLLFLSAPLFIHRLWTALVALLALILALDHSVVFAALPTLYAAAFALLALNEFKWAHRGALVQPLIYALAACLGWMIFPHLLPTFLIHRVALPAGGHEGLAIGLVLFGSVLALLRRATTPAIAPASSTGTMALAAAALLALLSYRLPGIGLGGLLLVIGFANGNRLLLGIGLFGLLASLSSYYYFLDATLLEKSLILGGAGIALLAARWTMLHLTPTPKAPPPHA